MPARAGASVVVLEKEPLHTDQVLSTHTIHPGALDVLDDLGVGDAVRAVAPPSRVLRIAKNDAFVDMQFADGRAEYCPRRKRLDGLLQDAATAAGAELRERTRVVSLLQEGERVVGVRTTDRAHARHPLRIQEVVFRNANQSPELRTRLARVAEHTLSPYDVFPAATVLRWTLGAAIKGSPGLLLEFLTMGKRGALVARERRAAISSRMRDVNPHR